MPTQTEYIDNIFNVVSGFVPGQDDRLTPPQILFWIEYYREQFMMQSTDYGQDLPGELWIDMGLWELELVDKAETPLFDFGMTIRKTINKVPKPIQFPLFRGEWVGSTDKQSRYVPCSPNNARVKVSNPMAIASGIRFCWRIGEYYYVADGKCSDQTDLKYVNIRTVPHSPAQCHYYNGDGTGRAYNPDTDLYPVTDAITSMIVRSILITEFGLGSRVLNDITENAQDNTGFTAPIKYAGK